MGVSTLDIHVCFDMGVSALDTHVKEFDIQCVLTWVSVHLTSMCVLTWVSVHLTPMSKCRYTPMSSLVTPMLLISVVNIHVTFTDTHVSLPSIHPCHFH